MKQALKIEIHPPFPQLSCLKTRLPSPMTDSNSQPTASDTITPPLDITVRAFQDLIKDRYFASDNARGTAGTFLYLTEEFGELATALANNNRSNKPPTQLKSIISKKSLQMCSPGSPPSPTLMAWTLPRHSSNTQIPTESKASKTNHQRLALQRLTRSSSTRESSFTSSTDSCSADS